ncbi:MAG: hypothetical protein AAF487_03605 [Bacteroidota bacterium]
MKRTLLSSILVFFLALVGQAGVIFIEGTYQLRNVFVMNGENPEGVGFCTTEVRVNGDVTTDEINSSAYEVDLSQYGFKMGDKVEIEIIFKEGCQPTVLNPGALKPATTFEISDIQVDANGLLTWSTINEQGALPFVVQQYKWNKWVNIGQIDGIGTSNENEYQFQAGPISGLNRFRIVQKNFEGKMRKSPEVSFNSEMNPVTFKYSKKEQKIVFSGKTAFEVFNEQGQIVKRGSDSEIDVSGLRKNKYYLAYDNLDSEFMKK